MTGPNRAESPNPLKLPRILCLHGGGTNARIFQAQCRVLARAIAPHYRLCFAEAPFSATPGPDVVSVYQEWGPFRAWIPLEESESNTIAKIEEALRSAMDDDNARGATGTWVGLLGFSQGAKVCASLLFRQQQDRDANVRLFGTELRFGIIMAGRGPLLSFAPHEQDTGMVTLPLSTPTLHVHGRQDPGLTLHRNLAHQFCDKRTARVLEWDGAHRIPIKTADVEAVVRETIRLQDLF
ncbi:MAG: hypothetical protein Q9165_008486 [Trypethelium subeluteriae]